MTDLIELTRRSLIRSMVPIVFVVILFLALVGALFWGISSNISQAEEYRGRLERSLETRALARQTFSALQDAVIGERGYLLTGDSGFLQPYEAAVDRLPDLLDRLVTITADTPRHQSALQLQEFGRAEISRLSEAINTYQEVRPAAATESMGAEEGRRWMERFRAVANDLVAAENRDVKRHSLAVREQTERFERMAIGLAVALALLLIAAAVIAGRYVLHRRRAEQELLLGGRRFEAASRAKTEFLASMSHEIRTPLNGIIGYTDLLLDQALSSQQRQLGERIQFAGAALLTVVNDILDFSKIEAGEIHLHPRPFSLKVLIDNTTSIVAATAERKGLALEVELGPDLPQVVLGDEARIRQILLNLLNNAVKFTQKGRVRLQVVQDDSSDSPERLRFSVSDTGIGIPEDQRKHLFHRFYQVNQSNTRQFGGTGLGLAISKRLVQIMGGEIGLESQEGEGSTFWFVVALPHAKEGDIPQDQGAPAGDLSHSGRILLVEDLEHNRDLARAILIQAGHQVHTAENGARAVEAVQATSYDLILMDIQMPVMDGITATHKIREMGPPASQIPIIAMTANVLPHQLEEFGEAGMDDHIGKPFNRTNMVAKINNWLERSRMPSQSTSAPQQDSNTALDELREMMSVEWVESGLTKLRHLIEETFQEEAEGITDQNELARRAHQIVSHAGILGFGDLSELCSRLEESCKSGADLAAPFEKAKTEAQLVRQQAGRILADTGGTTSEARPVNSAKASVAGQL
ncbi:MAG: ATP-binding protein [Limimaricola soesokkakensis]|uniref:ATP-binding protein n=1 Tax=Limimaricola soesokkakensis TaxID=1343159 RepID=UPI00405A1127